MSNEASVSKWVGETKENQNGLINLAERKSF